MLSMDTQKSRNINEVCMFLLSLNHSHRSSHLSIISFLFSVNCSNFSLICTKNKGLNKILQPSVFLS